MACDQSVRQETAPIRAKKVPTNELSQKNISLLEDTFAPLKAGYILTNYFEEGDDTYCIFEKQEIRQEQETKAA